MPAEDARPLEEIEAATRKEEARNRRAEPTESICAPVHPDTRAAEGTRLAPAPVSQHRRLASAQQLLRSVMTQSLLC